MAPAQWHVTLRFLGSVDPDLVPGLDAALAHVAAGQAPVLARLGAATAWFGRGDVLQVPVTGLDGLAGTVREATEALVPQSERDPPFAGHLTLGRSRRRHRPSPATRRALGGMPVSAEFAVADFDLVASEPTPAGHRYRVLATYPLAGRADG